MRISQDEQIIISIKHEFAKENKVIILPMKHLHNRVPLAEDSVVNSLVIVNFN